MAKVVNEKDFSVYALDEDTAVVKIKEENFVMDYSSLMDFLTELAVVAGQIENGHVNTGTGHTCCAAQATELH